MGHSSCIAMTVEETDVEKEMGNADRGAEEWKGCWMCAVC